MEPSERRAHRREAPSRIETFNQGVRSIVTLTLTGGFVWGFIFGGSDKVSSEVFSTVFAGVIGYWFASRDAKTRASDLPPTTTTRTADTTTVVGPTPAPPAGG